MSANDWGVSDIGFYKPTYEEIVLEKEKQAKLLFGDDFDTSELTPQGKFIRLNAKDEARLYDQLEFTYYCINPGTATGVSLDRICKFVAIKRTPATYAVKILRVYGKKDYIIQSGVLFKSENNIQFWSTSESTINKEELTQDDAVMYYADVTVQCVSTGTVGNITDIVSTAAVDVNITQVTYLSTVAVGQEAESDSEHSKFGEAVADGTFDVEDLAMGFIRFDNGSCLQFEFSWASNIEEEKRFVELRGTKAGFTWGDDGSVKIFGEEEGQLVDEKPELPEMGNGHDRAIRHFSEILLDGRAPDYVPQQGLDMIKILDGIYESARTGKEVLL